MRNLILASLLAMPLFSGCAAAVIGVGAGIVASQELLDNDTYVSHLNQDVKHVWPVVKTYLSDASPDLIEVDEALRVAQARIDGSLVTVSVEAYDIDRCIMKVGARRYGVNDGEMAGLVVERLHKRLSDQGR